MKRRDFFGITGLFTGGLLFPFSKLFGKNILQYEDEKIWTELVDYARWCPSPHNVQPWKLKPVSKTEAQLYYDPVRLPFIVDGTSAFTTAGMGMFIECLDIAARPLGYKVIAEHANEKQMDASAKELKHFSKLYLIETNEKGNYDRELIKQRKTSRLQYDGKIIDPSVIKSLINIAGRDGYEFIYSSDKELIDYCIDLNNQSVMIRANESEACVEMQKWIRTNDNEAAEKKDGWWYRCTGISAKMLHNFFYHHERFEGKWKTKRSVHMLNKSMTGTANLAWISGPFENRTDWINAGIMLQRLWLEMTKHNLYMHPFGPVITTQVSKEKFKQRINYNESMGDIWFLIRLGYSDSPPRSFRLDTKDILIT